MHRKTKKQILAEERAIRIETTSNGRRKEEYKSMSASGKLGSKELAIYFETRAYVLNHFPAKEVIELPYENPTRGHYDLAKTLCGKLQGCLEEVDTHLFS
jgi:hypothetical protein